MPQTLKSFNVSASKFGGELMFEYEYPSSLPTNYKVYVFKRSKSDVTQQEIDDYFANIANLSNYNYNGLMVFDQLNPKITRYGDYVVRNDVTYYYKAVLRDEDNGTYSPTSAATAKPFPSLKVNVKDGKQIVKTAIEKLLDNIYDANNNKVQLGKEISIVKNFSLDPISDNYIMIERVNGSTAFQFWGNDLMRYQSQMIKGDIDTDVIRATFITQDTPERRDKVINIFRANKQVLIKFCKGLGANDCRVTIEGDYYNPQLHGVNATGFQVIFTLLITNYMSIPEDILTSLVKDLQVKND